MKVTVHLEGDTKAALARQLKAHLAMYEETKTTKAAKVDDGDVDDDTDKGGDTGDTDNDDIDNDDDDNNVSDDDGPTLAQVKSAFAGLVKSKGNDKTAAIKILKKYGVKKPEQIEEGDFDEVLTLIKKAQASKK